MSKVTVEDVVNLSPRELINKMTAKGAEPIEDAQVVQEPSIEPQGTPALTGQAVIPAEQADTTSEQVPAPEQVAVDQAVLKQEFNKKLLKGFFDDAHVFVKGQIFTFDTGTVEVISVENSSGRIKFKDKNTGEVFSQAAAVLRGGKEELPYKKGDTVIFEGREFEVIGLNPANRNVVIMLDGKKRYLKISKVTAGGLVQGKIPSDGE
jgi:hypothetical protein